MKSNAAVLREVLRSYGHAWATVNVQGIENQELPCRYLRGLKSTCRNLGEVVDYKRNAMLLVARGNSRLSIPLDVE